MLRILDTKRRIAAFLLAILLLLALLPLPEVKAWPAQEGQACTSSFSDDLVGFDGQPYYMGQHYYTMLYHADGSRTYTEHRSGRKRRHYVLVDASGARHWCYCAEAGVDFVESSDLYTSQSGTNSQYFQQLPRSAQWGMMLAGMYGWQEGKTLPIGGINQHDYWLATQMIIWEYQQLLRTTPQSRVNNGPVDADTFYDQIKGRPAELAYNWILGQISHHATLPSFCSSNLSSANTYTLKYNPQTKLFSLTLTDTNHTGVDLQAISGSGVTVTREGNQYTFTSERMLSSPVGLQYRKKIPTGFPMMIWGCTDFQTMMTGADDPVVFAAKFKTETYGTLKLLKTSEDGNVGGIDFVISGNGMERKVQTDAQGQISVNDLLPGAYTITEQPPASYVVPASQTILMESGKTTTVSFANVLKKWRATVTKKDKETETAQGDASLAGAIYGVYRGGKLMDTYTTDASGAFTTAYYPCASDWTLREIAPSEGYLLDSAIYEMGASPGEFVLERNTIDKSVKEQVVKGRLRIVKHLDQPNGDVEMKDTPMTNAGSIEQPEAGAVFEVYLASAGSYERAKADERDLLTTDTDGFAVSKELPYGNYLVHQRAGAQGQAIIPDFYVCISQQGKTYSYILNNWTLKAKLRVEKRDAETGERIAASGIGFQIRDAATGELVKQGIDYPTPVVLDTYYTNSEGWLMLPEPLPYGKYELVEVQTAQGYVLSPDPVSFAVDGTEETITVVKENKPQKGKISILKRGEVFSSVEEKEGIYRPLFTEQGLAGVTFDIYAAEDIVVNGRIVAKENTLLQTLKTDASGSAASNPLYLGKYRLAEHTPSTMVDAESAEIEIVYAGQDIEVTSVCAELHNDRQKVKIELDKAWETDDAFQLGLGDEWKGISFGLFAAEDITAADGSVIPQDGLVEVINVNENGHAAFAADLPHGRWYVQEYATDKHYVLDDARYPVDFSYTDGAAQTVEIQVNNAGKIENKLLRGQIHGKKTDEDGAVLQGAHIGLFFPEERDFIEENAILVCDSGEDGSFGFRNVPWGHWIIAEITPPTGCVLTAQVHHVYITGQEQSIQIAMENRHIIGQVQITKRDGDLPQRLVSGVEFACYMDNGDGKAGEGDAYIGILEETELGVYQMNDLRYGTYYIQEVSVPDENYRVDSDPYFFAIAEDGETVVVKNSEQGFQNAVRHGELRIAKRAEDGKLEGFSFLIAGTDFAGLAYSEIFKTDADGRIKVELRPGQYTVSEVSDAASARYILPEEQSVEIKAEETSELAFYNELSPVPQTGDDNMLPLMLGLTGAALGGLIAFVILRFKRK